MTGGSRVLFVAALAYAAGIGVAWHREVLLPQPWCLGLATSLIVTWMRPRRARCRVGLLCVSLVCLGGLAAASQWIWWSEWIDRLIDAGSRVELEAIPLQVRSDKWLFIPVGDQWQDKARGRPPYLQLKRGTLDPRHHLQAADIGRCVRLSGRLTAPERPGNPGEFDPVNYALSRNLMGDLRLDSISACDAGTAARAFFITDPFQPYASSLARKHQPQHPR
ncbi:MAG: hypothetical protein GX162_07155 [Firmicutes bacterium]|jgi:hypothetical protein|nr:hypothetical protein [Bacillota bacterium]